MQRTVATALAVLLVVGSVAPLATGSTADPAADVPTDDRTQSEAYAGSHVSFQATGDAIANYSVGGEEVLASVETQPRSEYHAESGIDLGVSLGAVTDVAGVDLSLEVSTETRAEVQTESGATLSAHDSERGILTVDAGEEAHYAEVDLGADAQAESESDGRVAVDTGERTGAFVVVGDGEVDVNEDGSVVADLESESTLVFRAYEGERDEADREQERLITEGTATAEVYAEQRDGERVADAATYGDELTVDARSGAEQRVNLTVDRATSEGTVVIATVSEEVVAAADRADDVSVTVDGEAAAEASSYSELAAGIGEEPRYMVSQSSEASASADVLVAVDHFSEREVAIEGEDGSSGDGAGSSDGGTGETSSDGGSDDAGGDQLPGFGILAALLALGAAAAHITD